ncbi:bacterio-opsin activator domain-containing protein [Haloarchaeobius amylolyticus]|uniref:bacterio-opsin activator domain-containing protein n=1 Tax=Haloarchaeobius amylolyticus TaxID=1198296 RepID=UPI0022719ABC|nr:bacterio-opsin activator domain-containing protein [Haloarchaeobius amylolyticus]
MSQDGIGQFEPRGATTDGVTVLFVDNDPDFADVSKAMLERENAALDIVPVPDGEAALAALDDGRPVDCIVSDYDMPVMNGLELLEAVRERDERLPFILFTGKGSEEIASEAIAAGVTQYLQKKPGRDRFTLLANQIGNAVSQYRTESALRDRVRQQEAVAAIGQQALNEPQLDVLFETTVRRVARALDVSHVRVLRRSGSTGELLPEAEVGWDAEATPSAQARYVVDADDTPVVVVDDIAEEERFEPNGVMLDAPVQSGACVAIGLRGETWGVLEAHASTHRKFTQDDVTFLQNVATVLASAVERSVIESERRESSERYRTLVEVSPNPILVHRDLDVVYANPAVVSLLRAESAEAIMDRSIADIVPATDLDEVEATINEVEQGTVEPTRRERRIVTDDGTVKHVETTSRAIEYEGEQAVLTIATDITERKQYEQTLNTLHETTRDLMRAETYEDICETTAGTAGDLLGLSALVVYQFDSEVGTLEPAATTPNTPELLESPPSIERGESNVWSAFSAGESRYFPDVEDGSGLCAGVESELVIPLGTHGAIVAASGEVDGLDESTIEMLHILAANTEAALDRAEREQLLRDHDRTLSRQNEELRKLNHTNKIVRDVNRAVAQASTRREIEQAVCDRLADADPYVCTWVGEVDPATESMSPLVWADADANYMDRVGDTAEESTPEGDLCRRATEEQSVQVIENVLNAPDWEERRTESLTYGFQTVVAVPLVDNERVYSVLVLHVSTPETVTDREVEVLAELGQTIGYAIHAVERTRALVTDSRIELEFRVDDERLSFSRLSKQVGGTLTLDGAIARPDGTHLCFVTIEGVAPDAVEETVADWSAVTSITRITEDEDDQRTLFELRLAEPRLFELLREYDGSLRELEATDGVTELLVELPQGGDTRGLWNDIQETYPGTELGARRETTSTARKTRDLRTWVESELTDRQFEALQAAFYAGFYAWPRGVTGEKLADALDVTPPTYHYHLRAAERKLVESVFEADSN